MGIKAPSPTPLRVPIKLTPLISLILNKHQSPQASDGEMGGRAGRPMGRTMSKDRARFSVFSFFLRGGV